LARDAGGGIETVLAAEDGLIAGVTVGGVEKVGAHAFETGDGISTATASADIGRTGGTYCRGQEVVANIAFKTMRNTTLLTVGNSTATGVARGPEQIVVAVAGDTGVGGVGGTDLAAGLGTLVAFVVGRVEVVATSALETVCGGVAVDAA
jgi:hypothetical protein